MAEVLLDALIDSLKVFAVVTIATFIIALIEPKLSEKIKLKGKLAPLIGVSVALLPQCGFSVVATDLYQKRHISVGTLIGVYLATSDEAMVVFLSYPQKALHFFPILALKFAIGLLMGYLIDAVYTKSVKSVHHHLEHCEDEYRIKLMHCESAELVENKSDCLYGTCDCEECKDSACDHHHIHHIEKRQGVLYEYSIKLDKLKDKNEKIKRFFVKPISHSIEIFLYVLIINIIFGIVFYFVGEDRILSFLIENKYTAPLFAVIVGMIPNCASSIIISELYIMGGLGFGATIGGLLMNAGVAFTLLLKNKKHIKGNLAILAVMFLISVVFAYIFSLIFNFEVLSI